MPPSTAPRAAAAATGRAAEAMGTLMGEAMAPPSLGQAEGPRLVLFRLLQARGDLLLDRQAQLGGLGGLPLPGDDLRGGGPLAHEHLPDALPRAQPGVGVLPLLGDGLAERESPVGRARPRTHQLVTSRRTQADRLVGEPEGQSLDGAQGARLELAHLGLWLWGGLGWFEPERCGFLVGQLARRRGHQPEGAGLLLGQFSDGRRGGHGQRASTSFPPCTRNVLPPNVTVSPSLGGGFLGAATGGTAPLPSRASFV